MVNPRDCPHQDTRGFQMRELKDLQIEGSWQYTIARWCRDCGTLFSAGQAESPRRSIMAIRDDLHQRIENDFSFHGAAPDSHRASLHEAIRAELRMTAHRLVDATPISREQSLMLTALEEAMHWGNAAVAKADDTALEQLG